MKKLLVCLGLGLLTTTTSIILKSNLAIFISMVTFFVVPLSLITMRVIRRQVDKEELATVENINQKVVLRPIEFDHYKSKRERLKTEATHLQAELVEINKIDDKYQFILAKGKWAIRAEIHQRANKELYDEIITSMGEDSESLPLIAQLRKELEIQ